MSVGTTGDLAVAYSLRQRNSDLKAEVQKLNEELTTGIAADLTKHLGGSFARLSSVERDMRILDGFKISIAEATQYSEAVQLRLSEIADMSQSFGGDLLTATAANGAAAPVNIAAEARMHFETVVATMNTQSAGRSLFAGDASDRAALIDSADILDEIRTVVGGLTDPVDIRDAIDTWFDDPAGFELFAYRGSATAIAPFRMSDTIEIGVDVRANDPAIRDVLRTLSYAAISDDTAISLAPIEEMELLRSAAEGLLTAQERIIGLQSSVGLAQEQITGWSVRNASERIGTEYAKSALLQVDPYETATRLEAAQFQMQSLYTVTVRLSQLSLVNFLR